MSYCINVLIDGYANVTPRLRFILLGIRENAGQKKLPLRLFQQPEDLARTLRKESCHLVLVLSESKAHSEALLRFLNGHTIHPIFVHAKFPETIYSFSCISSNLYSALYKLTKIIINEYPDPSVFVGFNEDSFSDKCQLDGFTTAMVESGIPYKIVANTGNIEGCINSVIDKITKYKNYICANDELALLLIKALKKNGLPLDNFNISGSSNMKIGALSKPSLTTVMGDRDHYNEGILAVDVYVFQYKHKAEQNIFNNLNCEIVLRESTHLKAKTPDVPLSLPHNAIKFVDFYGSPAISRIDRVEYMLANCDGIDRGILHGLIIDKTYEQIAELNNIAINTVKYRIKKMENNLDIRNRGELRGYLIDFDLDL
jgi:DNA-binding LacI/PurR family transcriptional regulator